MPISRDIARTYRGPGRIARELYAMGPREDRAIMWLMLGCFLVFISRLPALQRAAVNEGADFQQDAIYTFFGMMMVAPLVFYAIAFAIFGLAKVLRPAATVYGARLAVFWGWLAAAPLALFYGLLVGFNGLEHPGTRLIGGVWLAVLAWFWLRGLIVTSEAE